MNKKVVLLTEATCLKINFITNPELRRNRLSFVDDKIYVTFLRHGGRRSNCRMNLAEVRIVKHFFKIYLHLKIISYNYRWQKSKHVARICNCVLRENSGWINDGKNDVSPESFNSAAIWFS